MKQMNANGRGENLSSADVVHVDASIRLFPFLPCSIEAPLPSSDLSCPPVSLYRFIITQTVKKKEAHGPSDARSET
jgi:hypothetical protein